MTNFTKHSTGVKINFGVGVPMYVQNPQNLRITGKQLPKTVDPIVKADKVFVSWSEGGINVWRTDLQIDGVTPATLELAVEGLHTVFNGEAV